MSQAAVVDELVNRMSGTPGVEGIVILNADGIPVKSTLPDRQQDLAYAALICDLVAKGRQAVRMLDALGDDTVQTIRLRSEQYEIVIAPEKDVTMIIIQKPAIVGK
eukprot:ANDGO_08272.mRNA.1 hypothetical protein GUITHDRAFT_93470